MNRQPQTNLVSDLWRRPTPMPWLYSGADLETAEPSLIRLLGQFQPISLAQMEAVALLDRTDTKYVLTMRQLESALASLSDQYWVLDIGGERLNPYQTIYFDTADFALYLRHHAGRRDRCKVRSRRYVDTDTAFLEVKLKTARNRTLKRRIETPGLVTRFTPEVGAFVHRYFPLHAQPLEPKLWNDFLRITLVSRSRPERLTLDVNVRFGNDRQTVALPGLVVAEVKQARQAWHSDFGEQMRAAHIRPARFSKYCVGVSRLYPVVKHNRFKPMLRAIDQLTGGTDHVQRLH